MTPNTLKPAPSKKRKVKSVFFPAGNSIAMPACDLAAICRYSKAKFRDLQRITVYGSSQYIAKKGPADMAELKEADLSRIHVGLESGDDITLKRVKKGTDASEQIKAGKMVKQAGMELSEYVVLFQLLSPRQVLKETRLLLENLHCQTRLASDHYTNYLNLSGNLPEDKNRLIVEIDRALTWDPGRFRPFFIGTQ